MKKSQIKRRRDAQFHLWLDSDILDQLKELAQVEGRTVTELLREAVALLLRQRKLKRG